MGRNYYGGTVLLLIVLGCGWAALDWKSTGHDVVIALMIMLLVCISFCAWICGPKTCLSFCYALSAAKGPESLVQNAQAQRQEEAIETVHLQHTQPPESDEESTFRTA
eukprot:Rhum_TRINITY_DN20746_c0_g1::Rhum_TRINITY_DN20746_c0_g1_i1::g.171887::m.171887